MYLPYSSSLSLYLQSTMPDAEVYEVNAARLGLSFVATITDRFQAISLLFVLM